MMKLILHGHLAEQFGAEHEFAAKTASELLAAMAVNHSGFMKSLRQAEAYDFLTELEPGVLIPLTAQEAQTKLLPGPLHVVPSVEGREVTTILISIAVSLVMTGIGMLVNYLLAPEMQNYDSMEEEKSNFLFTNAINRTEQGGPIPIIYGGPILVGSTVVSSGVDAVEIGGAKNSSTIPDNGIMQALYQDASESTNKNAVLKSKNILKVVDIIGEGRIAGLAATVDTGLPARAARSVLLDGTRIMADDGRLNFKGVLVQQLRGTSSQKPMPGAPTGESEVYVGAEVQYGTPVVRTIDAGNINDINIKIRFPQGIYSVKDKKEGVTGWKVSFSIALQPDGGSYETIGTYTIQGKSQSPYEKSYKIIDLESYGDGPWNIRITRTSTEDPEHINTFQFYSYTRIMNQRFSMPDTAAIGVHVDASLFGERMPQRAYEVYGLDQIKIPSNYNPTTRTYTETWDGTFATGWTNNPAWCLYDLATNPRYGLGEGPFNAVGLTEDNVNKWAFYTVGQQCDVLVSDGFGGFEPRFTFNYCITTREEAIHAINSILSAFTSMAHWSGAMLTPFIDLDDDVSHIVTPANVENGIINYSGKSLKDTKTVALVTWNDPEDNYRPAIEVYEDTDLIAKYGWIPIDVLHVGCTSRGQARRFGAYQIESQKDQETINFTGGVYFSDCVPGSIIEVHDPFYDGLDSSGRIIRAIDDMIVLDRVITLDEGVDYTLLVSLPEEVDDTPARPALPKLLQLTVVEIVAEESYVVDEEGNYVVDELGNLIADGVGVGPNYLVDEEGNFVVDEEGSLIVDGPVFGGTFGSRTIVRVEGWNRDDISLTSCVWGLASDNFTPRKFRVIVCQEKEPHLFEISGILHDPDRYDRIYAETFIDPTMDPNAPPLSGIDATTFEYSNFSYEDGNNWKFGLLMSWREAYYIEDGIEITDPNVYAYEVQWTEANAEEWTPLFKIEEPSATLKGIKFGPYDIRIRSRGRSGSASEWVTIEDVEARDDSVTVPDVTGLELKSGGTQFTGSSIDIVWDSATSVTGYPAGRHREYDVEILDPNNADALMRATKTGARNSYSYTLAMNEHDFGTPAREVKIRVKAQDVYGNRSVNWTSETFENPAPSMDEFTPTLTVAGLKAHASWASWTKPADMKEFHLYFDTNASPTTFVGRKTGRSDTSMLANRLDKSKTYYFRVVPHDYFGAGLSSNVVSTTGEVIDWDDIGGDNRPDDNADVTASKLSGSGKNVLPLRYSTFENRRLPSMTSGDLSSIGIDTSYSAFDLRSLKTVSSGAGGYTIFGSGAYSRPIRILPGKKWLVSGYVYSLGAGTEFKFQIRTATNFYDGETLTITTAGTWLRRSCIIDLSSDTNRAAGFALKHVASGTTIYWDALMVEEYLGDGTNTEPSPYTYGGPGLQAIPGESIEEGAFSDRYSESVAEYNLALTGIGNLYVIAGPTSDYSLIAGDALTLYGKIGDCEGTIGFRLQYSTNGGSSWSTHASKYVYAADDGGEISYSVVLSASSTRRYRLAAWSTALTDNLVTEIEFMAEIKKA